MSIFIFGCCVLVPLARAKEALHASAVFFGAILRLADFFNQARPVSSKSNFHLRQPVRPGPGRVWDISLTVSPLVVETPTTSSWRAVTNLAIRRSTPSIRSVLRSGVPPYFSTQTSTKNLKKHCISTQTRLLGRATGLQAGD